MVCDINTDFAHPSLVDLIEPAFRPLYEKISVGNKPANAQHVFFEGLLLEEGLGTH